MFIMHEAAKQHNTKIKGISRSRTVKYSTYTRRTTHTGNDCQCEWHVIYNEAVSSLTPGRCERRQADWQLMMSLLRLVKWCITVLIFYASRSAS